MSFWDRKSETHSFLLILVKLLDMHIVLPVLVLFTILHNQNPFFCHFAIECFASILGVSIFLLYWNYRHIQTDSVPLFIGISCLFVAILDLTNIYICFKVPSVEYDSTNITNQLWLAARQMHCICLLAAFLFYRKRISPLLIFTILTILTAIFLFGIIVTAVFPASYHTDKGITNFHKLSEFLISILLIFAITALVYRRKYFEQKQFILLLVSFLATLIGEFIFGVLYNRGNPLDLWPHYFKLLSYYYIYKALVHRCLTQPYEMIFKRYKDNEASLIASEERFRAIADYTSNWEDWIGTDLQPEWLNSSVQSLTGYTPEECLKMYDYPLSLVHPDDREYYNKARNMVFASHRQMQDIPFRIIRKDGEIAWMSASWNPILDSDGIFVGIRSSIHDITRAIESEQERNYLDEKLQARNAELESMIQIASHDLRSPLVNIDGFFKELSHHLIQYRSELEQPHLVKNSHPTDTRGFLAGIDEILSYIRPSVDKMFQILDGLLKITRLGHHACNIEKVDMNKLIGDILKSHSYRARNRGAAFKIFPLPPCQTDASQISIVFSNLIDNALKYLDSEKPGLISIEGEILDDKAIYRVIDNGIGIAPEHQDVIFNIFYRIDPQKYEGDGLGLCAVRRILDRLDGRVTVKSQPGQGSCFSIELPTADL